MNLDNELTYMQKIAFQGEMALTLSTARHTPEVMYRIYLVLKETPKQFIPALVEVTRDIITFPETDLDRIVLEVTEGSVPAWLWIRKAVADIKESLVLNEMMDSSPAKIDKRSARKMITESAVIRFIREAATISPSTAIQLCHEIIDDNSLDFLHTAAFTLISSCQDMARINKEESGIDEMIMDCVFNINTILSSRIETEALDILNNPEKAKKHMDRFLARHGKFRPNVDEQAEAYEDGSTGEINGEMISQTDLSDYISEKISELFNGVAKPSKSKKRSDKTETAIQTRYIVRKTFKGSNASSTLKIFSSKEEAVKFVAQLKEEFPELEKTCTFEILKQSTLFN